MARPQYRTANSVSLFPFLAVLVCAMGALIFLLIVTTRRARAVAVAQVKQVQPSLPEVNIVIAPRPVLPEIPPEEEIYEKPEPEVLPEPVKRRRAIVVQPDPDIPLKQELAALTQQLQTYQKRLSQVSEDLTSSRKRMDKTKSKLSEIENLRGSSQEKQKEFERLREETKQEHQTLLEQMVATKLQIQRAHRENLEEESKYSLFPFDGQTGTTRRPILIECVGSRIRFLPEGITLQQDDLEGFTLDTNPLLAGAGSLMQYWTKKSLQENAGKNGQPYILLLVRPSGSVAYYAARKLLSGLNQQHGYELIEEDWQLELPETDPEARRLCQAAIQQAMTQRRRPAETLVHSPKQDSAGGRTIRFHRETGSFEVVEPDSESGGQNGRGKNSKVIGSNGDGSSGSGRQGFRGSGGFGQNAMRREGTGGSVANRDSRNRGFNSGPGFGKNTGQSNDGQSSRKGFNAGNATGNGENSFPKPITSGFAGREQRTGSATQSDSISRGTQSGGDDNNPFVTRNREGSAQSPSGNPFAERNPFSQSSQSFQSRNEGSEPGSGSAGTRNRSEEGPAFGSPEGKSGDSGSSKQNRSEFSSRNNDRRTPGGRREQGTSGTNNLSSNQTSGGGQPATSSQPMNSGSSFSPNVQLGQKKQKSKQPSNVRNRRRRWGHSGLGSSIGFEQEIVIRIQQNQLAIGRKKTIRIQAQGLDDDALTDRVLEVIEQQARSWGKPPTSFYWVPKIRFQIDSTGLNQIERLREPLHQAGLFWEIETLNQSASRPRKSE